MLATMPTDVTLTHVVSDPNVGVGTAGDVQGKSSLHDKERFRPGPANRRIIVVDHGDFGPGIPVSLDGGRYVVRDEKKVFAPDCCALSAFSIVVRVLSLVEEPAGIGRELVFPFPDRLRIEPLAGDWNNACYERSSGSLRFWTWVPPGQVRRRFLALSHDTVAHETGHVIIDALAPDLHDASHPQSLGLHEALADLIAFIAAVQNPTLLQALLAEGPHLSLDELALLHMIGESAGGEGPGGASKPIRRLDNQQHVDPARHDSTRVDSADPHALAEVLGGLIYDLMLREPGQAALDPTVPATELQPLATMLLSRVYAALDVLPPGEATFLDLARTMVAWARLSGAPDQQLTLEGLLVQRGLLAVGDTLRLPIAPFPPAKLGTVPRQRLLASERSAANFVRRNRELFGVDPGVALRAQATLRTRLVGEEEQRWLVVRASWDRQEDQDLGPAFPSRRWVKTGSTVVLRDAPGVEVLLVLPPRAPDPRDAADRTAFLRNLRDSGRLKPAGGRTPMGLRARREDGGMRLEGTARALHVQPDAAGPVGGFRPVPDAPDVDLEQRDAAMAF
jgi:hypothetical protein